MRAFFSFFFIFLQDHVLYFIQCACSPATLMSNFRSNVLEIVQVAGRCSVSIFHDFCKPVIVYPVYMACFHAPDSGPSYDTLNLIECLADLANVSVAKDSFISLASPHDAESESNAWSARRIWMKMRVNSNCARRGYHCLKYALLHLTETIPAARSLALSRMRITRGGNNQRA